MQITLDWLKEKGACPDGIEWFLEKYPNGGDHQTILNHLAQEDKDGWATWLLSNVGKTETKLELDELVSDKSVFFTGSIVVKGKIIIKGYLFAGLGIEAGDGIKAG